MTVLDAEISELEADAAFASFAAFDVIVIAVSGGADSMALLELAAEWVLRQKARGLGPALSVATVDHRLRADSAAEARRVAERCAVHGLSHTTLHWDAPKPLSGISDAARQARYALLGAHVRHLGGGGSSALVTAHHQDDQAETLVMRLARGSGVVGLSAMSGDRALDHRDDVRLLRPLLGLPKSRLVATLNARGLDWSEDPSNADTAYERVRVRAALATLASAGVTRAALARSARRLDAASDALDFADAAFRTAIALDLNAGLFASFDRTPFDAGPSLLRERLLGRVIDQCGGDSAAPQLGEIEALARRIAHLETGAATLGGANIAWSKRRLKICREAGRMPLASLPLAAGSVTLFDSRFWLRRDGRPDIDVTARALGEDGLRLLRGQVGAFAGAPQKALHALPGFWLGSQLIAIPCIQRPADGQDSALELAGVPAGLKVRAEAVGLPGIQP